MTMIIGMFMSEMVAWTGWREPWAKAWTWLKLRATREDNDMGFAGHLGKNHCPISKFIPVFHFPFEKKGEVFRSNAWRYFWCFPSLIDWLNDSLTNSGCHVTSSGSENTSNSLSNLTFPPLKGYFNKKKKLYASMDFFDLAFIL